MAGPDARAAASGRVRAGASLASCLAEARDGKPAPVYLLDGDAFLALRAGRELARALVPEASRALNLVELDAATSAAEVAEEVATGGLFGGGKVVLVHEPAFLAATREDLAELFAGAAKAWAEGRQREGSRRLLALAAKVGVGQRGLAPGADGKVPDAARSALSTGLGVTIDPAAERFIDEAARYAHERELKVGKGGDGGELEAAIGRGFPAGHVLIIAAGKVDGRLPLVKRLAAAGRRVSVRIETEGTWEAQRLVLGPVLEALLAGTGKRVDRGGEARLAELVGDDARALASEVEKLAAYVGAHQVITAADVDQVVARTAGDPFFALGNALEARDLPAALGVVDRSLADGASPFMLLGVLASTVRRLVVERERARRVVGERRIAGVQEWERLVLPTVTSEELEGKKPFGFWKKLESAQRFERAALLDALAGLAAADQSMKAGADGRPLLERVLWRLLARPAEQSRSIDAASHAERGTRT